MKPLKDMDAPELAAGLASVRPELSQAIALAAELHAGQYRRPRRGLAAPPYVEHPLRVATRLHRAGVSDATTLMSAILHDTVEDCGDQISRLTGTPPSEAASLNYLESRFGSDTADVVALLTHPKSGDYVGPVEQSVRKDPRALIVKTSDWLDNAGSLHHTPKLIPRMTRKYQPLTPVLLEQFDEQYLDVQRLLNGNVDVLRSSVLRAGFRLEFFSRREHPGR